MEPKIIKHQRGYLLIVAIIAIVIIGFVAAILARMYLTTVRSTTNILQSDQALYIAKAGLEKARRDLLKTESTLECNNININNACYPPGATNCTGRFNVTGSENKVNQSLQSDISELATTIFLNDTAGLLPQGIVVIENEAIWYPTISDETSSLQNVKRGVLGTTASDHSTHTPNSEQTQVIQNVCTLTATAGVPNLTDPGGKRVLKEMLWKKGEGVGSLPGEIIPVLVSAGDVLLAGDAEIYNPYVDFGEPKFPMSTIVSGGTITFQDDACGTAVGDPKTTASEKGDKKDDIEEGNDNFNADKIWGYFFSDTKEQVFENAEPVTGNCKFYKFNNNIPSNKTFLIPKSCSRFNPQTSPVGSSDAPVKLIFEGDVNIQNTEIYGLVYVIGNLEAQSNTTIHGLAVVEGNSEIYGTFDINFDPKVLYDLDLLGYNDQYGSWEDFN